MGEKHQTACYELSVERAEIACLDALLERIGNQFVRLEFKLLNDLSPLWAEGFAFLISDDRGAKVATDRFAICANRGAKPLQRIGYAIELPRYLLLIFPECCLKHQEQDIFFVFDISVYKSRADSRCLGNFLNGCRVIAVASESFDCRSRQLFAPPLNAIWVFDVTFDFDVHPVLRELQDGAGTPRHRIEKQKK